MGNFVHLHLHTEGSLADAMLKPNELAKRVKELGMDSVAVTDHGNMFKVIPFYQACKREGIKPIIGMEAYVAPESNLLKTNEHRKSFHLVLLCENNKGYVNLMQIASNASVEGFYYRPRTDKKHLRKWGEGLIALSACLGGEVQYHILNGDYDKAKESALEYEEIFGKGNFFLELQNHGIPEQIEVNKELRKLSRETGIPLVVTNDSHYLYADDYEAHDVLMAIQGSTTVDDDKRKKYASDQFYLKSPGEMYEIFPDDKEALENTQKIADRCFVEIDFSNNKLPQFVVPSELNMSNEEFLDKLVFSGLEKLYDEVTEEVIDRAKYELSVIRNMGYNDYFLIVWDFFRFCETGAFEIGGETPDGWVPIEVGPGRGSALGSIVSYSLGITKLCPLENDLMFERFLDPGRVSMPDIDSDFEKLRRGEVIEYVIKKYGRGSVAQIITFGTLAARASIRNVGKAMGVPYAVCDKVAKSVPMEPKMTLKKAYDQSPDFKMMYDTMPEVKKLIDIAVRLEGLPLHTSTHAAGVLITDPRGITAHVPVYDNDGAIVSQYDMDVLEDLKLLKMDFLGLTNLSIMKLCRDLVKRNHGKDINISKLYNAPDEGPFSILAKGYTQGIFQIESEGITNMIEEMAPKTIGEWTDAIALYRPGPMKNIPTYLNNRRDPSRISYEVSGLKEILDVTYGIIVYQEQVMSMAIKLAGYARSDADSFRKVMSSGDPDLLLLHRRWFIHGRDKIDVDKYGKRCEYNSPIPGGIKNGHSESALNKLFSSMEDFAKYAFNKSHSAGYARISYINAWMKYYYPAEYMAALMTFNTSGTDATTKLPVYIEHAREDLGINVLSPNVNYSEHFFNPIHENGRASIVYSLDIKHASSIAIDDVIRNRKDGLYKDLEDFVFRNMNSINKNTLLGFASVGALNGLSDMNMNELITNAEIISKRLPQVRQAIKRAENSGRTINPREWADLETRYELGLPDISEKEKWELEKEYLSVYLTGNPLQKYKYYIKQYSTIKLSDYRYVKNEEGDFIFEGPAMNNFKFTAIVRFTDVMITQTRKKKEKMAIAQVDDGTATIKLLIWPNIYSQFEEHIKEDNIVMINGYTKLEEDNAPVIIANTIESIEAPEVDLINVKIEDPFELINIANNIKRNFGARGDDPVSIQVGNFRLLLPQAYWINGALVNFKNAEKEILKQEDRECTTI